MKIDIVKQRDNLEVAVIHSDSVIIKDVSSALDFIMGVKYETGCTNIAINKGAITDDFFVLSTCLAGEILQKFINYGIRFAIYKQALKRFHLRKQQRKKCILSAER